MDREQAMQAAIESAAREFVSKISWDKMEHTNLPKVMADFARQQLEAQKSQVIAEFVKRVEAKAKERHDAEKKIREDYSQPQMYFESAMQAVAKEMTAPEVCKHGNIYPYVNPEEGSYTGIFKCGFCGEEMNEDTMTSPDTAEQEDRK